MKLISTLPVVGLLAAFTASSTERPASTTASRIEPLPRDLEVQLALSALPAHLREGATVYVLNVDRGFEAARKGTNGFHAFVARTGEDTMRGSWPFNAYRDDILYPISFDPAGGKAHMRVFFDIAEMQAQGTTPAELKTRIQERYRTGYYKPPDRAGVSYMLSPILRTYTNPDLNGDVETTNNPHIMHYAPNVSNDDLGGVSPGQSPYPFVILPGPHGYTVQHLGQRETAAITYEYQRMLSRLCGMRQTWCLPAAKTH
jgi:hypothetical protein